MKKQDTDIRTGIYSCITNWKVYGKDLCKNFMKTS